MVPITLGIIFMLLYLNFRSVAESAIVMISLPFALMRGIWLTFLVDHHMSIAVGVGFIALASLSVELGVVMLAYLNNSLEARRAQGRLQSADDCRATVVEGVALRVRPILMTVLSTVGGLASIQ